MNDEKPENSTARKEAEQQAGQPPIVREQSRYKLAKYIVLGYMLLIVFAFMVPFIVYKFIGFTQGADPADKIVQILNAYVGALTGLTGLVGFIIGYYFKERSEGNNE